MEKQKILYVDMTILEDFCNLQCKYCGITKQKYGNVVYKPESTLYNCINPIMEIVNKNIDAPVLKISGGEIFMIEGIIDFVKEQSKNYPLIQILTNATLLNENYLDQLKSLGNIIFQVSLDGHTFNLNKNRFKVEAQFNRVVNNIKMIIQKGFPLEINTVITSSNIKELENYMDYLVQLGGKIRFYPFPARWVKNFDTKKSDIKILNKILNNLDRYNRILPSEKYMRKLVEFLEHKRNFPCFIPHFILGTAEFGGIKKCACGLFGPGMVTDENCFDKILMNSVTGINRKGISELCSTCFTHYDFYNLFLNSEIEDKEMESRFFEIEKPIFKRLLEIKELLKSRG